MRLLLALLALGLVALSVLWIAEGSAASRVGARSATASAARSSTTAPPEVAPQPSAPEVQRTTASSADEHDTPAAEADDFPHSALAGRVERHDGEPAAGVALEVRAAEQRTSARPLAELRTSADGSFETTVLGSGPFRLRAHESSGGGVRLESVLESVEAGSDDILLELPRTGRVRGHVVDERGKPVTKFELELRPDEDEPESSVQAPSVRLSFTAEDGAFVSEELASDAWRLSVSADGYVAAEPERCYPGEDALVIRLARECRLSGVVLGEDGRPRAGARVELNTAREPAFADANGAFVIGGRGGSLLLRARDPSSFEGSPIQLTVGPGQERTGLVLTLGASGSISGQVIGLASRPAVHRRVTCLPFPEDAKRESPPPCQTDALGRFRIDVQPGVWEVSAALTPEEIELLADAADAENRGIEVRTSEVVSVEPGSGAEVWLALAPAPVRVSGTLTKAGKPCPGGAVTAVDARGDLHYRARVEGSSYAFGLARPGPYEFTVTFGETTQLLWVDVPAVGAHTLDLDVPVGWIEGFVRTLSGERAGDVKVWASGVSGTGHAITNADGTFTLELAPGSYAVGTDDAKRQANRWGRWDGLQIEAGKRFTGLELLLVSESQEPALTVVLRGPRGELVNDGSVRLVGGPRYERAPPLAPAPQGSAEFRRLSAGEYRIQAEAPGYAQRESALVAVEWSKPKRFELFLARALDVVVHVDSTGARTRVLDLDAVDPSGQVFASTRAKPEEGANTEPGAGAAEPDASGELSFRFPALPVGEYRLRVFGGDGVIERPLRLDATAISPLRVDLLVP